MADWWELPLTALSPAQWEALCDGCGRCCLHKLEDVDRGTLHWTRISCRYLDLNSCRCRQYPRRSELVPACVKLSSATSEALAWLPPTCAYRLRADGQRLPDWHPLRSGTPESVHRAGISVRGRALSEEHVHPDSHEEHVVQWVGQE